MKPGEDSRRHALRGTSISSGTVRSWQKYGNSLVYGCRYPDQTLDFFTVWTELLRGM